jgi:hypothetical protein
MEEDDAKEPLGDAIDCSRQLDELAGTCSLTTKAVFRYAAGARMYSQMYLYISICHLFSTV